jgi:hypothetical protein
MERQAALDAANRLNRDEGPGSRVHWSVREVDGGWQVVSFEAPGQVRPTLKPSVGTKPHRPDPGELQPPVHRPEWGPV